MSECAFWRSVLSDSLSTVEQVIDYAGLNASFGARCYLTAKKVVPVMVYLSGLNAPFGARCFLTLQRHLRDGCRPVLIHVLALGAF